MTPQERRHQRDQASRERIQLLEDRLLAAIDYNADENDLSYTEVIGTLEAIKVRMFRELEELENEEC